MIGVWGGVAALLLAAAGSVAAAPPKAEAAKPADKPAATPGDAGSSDAFGTSAVSKSSTVPTPLAC